MFLTTFFDGWDAFNIELAVKRNFKLQGYSGPPLFKYTGNTEIFTTNPVAYIQQQVKDLP